MDSSFAKLAELPLLKSYSPEELDKIELFLRAGTVSPGLEWISEKEGYCHRHRMRDYAFLRGYSQELACIARKSAIY
jgi:hypothetical protein